MFQNDKLVQIQRVLGYDMYRIPSESELKAGTEVEYNTFKNSLYTELQPPHPLNDGVIVSSDGTYHYYKWGEGIITEHNIDLMKENLKQHTLRVRNVIDCDKIRELGWKYPLHFHIFENLTHYDVVLLPPGDYPRKVFINGKPKNIGDDTPSLLYTRDWYYITLSPDDIQRGGKALNPEKENIIYKNFKGIYTKHYIHSKNKSMGTKTLRNLLVKERLPLFFVFEEYDLEVIVMPKEDNLPNEVFVNGIEQRSIPWFSELHDMWFPSSKNCNQKRLDIRHDWRCLLDLNNGGGEDQEYKDVLFNYYHGVVRSPENIIEATNERWQEKLSKNPFRVAAGYIRSLLKERKRYGKKS